MNAKRWKSLLLALACLLPACRPARQEPAVSDVVALGDSMTMGIQDAGLVKDYQLNCYPYFIARQLGQASGFQQPLVSSPGIGVPPYETPLRIADGQIVPDYLDEDITELELLTMVFNRLENKLWADPYNNLGVNGARLHDLRYTTGYDHTFYGIANFFFDITLRNRSLPLVPNFGGKTMVEEAALLQPAYILLWIGNNDALGYVLGGGEDESRLLDPEEFEAEYRNILTDLQAGTPGAKIVLATIPQYLPFGYALDTVFIDGSPKLFDPKTFLPIDFDDGTPAVQAIDLYLQAEDEGPIEHLLLTGAAAYLEQGAGVPGGLTAEQEATLRALGIPVPETRIPLTIDLVFTGTEEQNALQAIADFNEKIGDLAAELSLPLVDANAVMQPGGGWDEDAYSFALVAQDSTAYSLDGIHPNNYGHALLANLFIAEMNGELGLSIPELDAEDYRGQYSGKAIQASALKSIQGLRKLYLPRE